MAEQYDLRFHIMEDASRIANVQQGVVGGISGGAEKAEKARESRDRRASLARLLGIQVSLAALLKNSQIFTGTIGAIFQILGGLIDITLAAFMPQIVGFLTMLAGIIPRWSAYTQAVMPSIIVKIDDIVGAVMQVVTGVYQFVSKPFSLFDKDGVSADGRLRLSDIIRALGTAVLGGGIYQALYKGSKSIVGAAVSSLMGGTIGKLLKWLRSAAWIALVFEGVNIASIWKASGIQAALVRLIDTIIMTLFSALGGFIGATLGNFIGLAVPGALFGAVGMGAAYSKYISPSVNRVLGGGGEGSSAQTFAAEQQQAYPVSETQSFVGSQSTVAWDYDRELPRIGAR